MKPVVLTPEEAVAWFEAALSALSAPHDRDRWAWVLDASRHVFKPGRRRRAIADLSDAADHNRRFGISESKRDARILCFCAAVLRALPMPRGVQ
jgi:hypothetical protein